MSIPKIIHYCWFGKKPLGALEKKCIDSWKKYCPDYELKLWTESNFNISCNKYVSQAYESGKYAFVSNYARLYAIYNYGGIYFDTDVELLKPIDSLLEYKAFIALEVGSPTPYGRLILANSGSGIGAEPHSETVRKMMRIYESIPMITETGRIDLTTCSERATHVLKKLGFDGKNRFQTVADFTVLPSEYFSPLDYTTKKFRTTDNTLGIHSYNGSWKHSTLFERIKNSFKCTKTGMFVMRIKRYGIKKLRGSILNLSNQLRFMRQRLFCKNLRFGKHLFFRMLHLRINKGSFVTIGNNVENDGKLTIVTDWRSTLSIGSNVYFNDNCMLSCLGKITIGDNTLFGCNVNVFDNNHKFGTSGVNRECKAGVIEIGKNCWIASNAVILKGTKIGDNCVIGAGCVVNCEIPEGSIVRQKNNLHIEKIVENDT